MNVKFDLVKKTTHLDFDSVLIGSLTVVKLYLMNFLCRVSLVLINHSLKFDWLGLC